jgi:hypothetical protein
MSAVPGAQAMERKEMDLDPKSIVVLVGTATMAAAVAYRLMPRSTDRLRRDLELLRLARGARVNHHALQRHVDAQIQEAYVRAGLSLKRKLDIVFGELFFAAMLGTAVMALIGVIIAFGARSVFPLDDVALGRMLTGFAALGLLIGLTGGTSEARKSLDAAQKEIRKRQQYALELEQTTLGEA